MGRIARLLSFTRVVRNGGNISDSKADPGGEENYTAEHFSCPGDDSHPLPGDYIVSTSVAGTGRESAIGYADPNNSQKALAGEKRVYSRDSSGAEKAQVWLKNSGEVKISNDSGNILLQPDGSMILTSQSSTFSVLSSGEIIGINGGGSFTLTAAGAFVVNGLTVSTSGRLTDGAGLRFQDHIHDQPNDSDGDSESPTNAPRNP